MNRYDPDNIMNLPLRIKVRDLNTIHIDGKDYVSLTDFDFEHLDRVKAECAVEDLQRENKKLKLDLEIGEAKEIRMDDLIIPAPSVKYYPSLADNCVFADFWLEHVQPLNDMLASGVEVYNGRDLGCWATGDQGIHTHKAILINIQPIKKEKASDVLREFLNSDDAQRVQDIKLLNRMQQAALANEE